jgi:hypothetical protein
MLDSGASHDVMTKAIMEKIGLEITRPYGDLYSFDSRKVKCIGMIKDLVVGLAQIPAKSILMDVVVPDIPPKYDMLLSRSWGAKLGGCLQLDMTYATIPIFGGQYMRLYRENRLAFTVGDPHNLNNHPVYIVDQDLGNCILSIDDDFEVDIDENCIEERTEKEEIKKNVYNTGVWKRGPHLKALSLHEGTKSTCFPRPTRKRGPHLEPMLKQFLIFFIPKA